MILPKQARSFCGTTPQWHFLSGLILLLPLNGIFSGIGALFIVFWVTLHQFLQKTLQNLDSPKTLGWLALSGWLMLSLFTSYNPSNSLLGLGRYIPYFLFCVVASMLLKPTGRLLQMLFLLVINALMIDVLGVLQSILNQPNWQFPRLFNSYILTFGLNGELRATSWFGHPNETGIFLVMVLPICLHFMMRRLPNISNAQKIIAAFTVVLSLITIILTGSRNAAILAVLALCVSAAIYRWWWFMGLIITLTLITTWALFGSYFDMGGDWLRNLLPNAWVYRMLSTMEDSRVAAMGFGSPPSQRIYVWQFVLSLIQERPILGWGMNNYAAIITDRKYDIILESFPHEHNLYLSLAVGAGIPMLIGFVGMVGWHIWEAIARSEQKELAMIVSLCVTLGMLSGFTDVVFFEPRLNLLLYLLFAMLNVLPRLLPTPNNHLNRN
jgi:O-antigen ligase